jgi:hypothetical protein
VAHRVKQPRRTAALSRSGPVYAVIQGADRQFSGARIQPVQQWTVPNLAFSGSLSRPIHCFHCFHVRFHDIQLAMLTGFMCG